MLANGEDDSDQQLSMKAFCTLLFLNLIVFTATSQTKLFVKEGGSGTGGSWANAAGSLQQTIDAAPFNSVIWVAAGTYRPDGGPFRLKEGIFVLGGFKGDESDVSQRNVEANPTILMGRGSSVLVNENIAGYCVLDGFIITEGQGTIDEGNRDVGGGVYNIKASLSFINCTFIANDVTGRGGGLGGAMFNKDSSPTIQDCRFIKNRARSGGAIYQEGGDPVIKNCSFIDNTAGLGGAWFNLAGSPNVINCDFTGNRAIGWSAGGIFSLPWGAGGAWFNKEGAPRITNCRFLDNFSGNVGRQTDIPGDGGAWYQQKGSGGAEIANCHFQNNTANRSAGGAVFAAGGNTKIINSTFYKNIAGRRNEAGTPTQIRGLTPWDGSPVAVVSVNNCIVWGTDDKEGVGKVSISGDGITVANSNVEGGYHGTNNIDRDPLFVDADAGNLQLKINSPCINKGRNSALPVTIEKDIAGNPRIFGGVIDMGAYEYTPYDASAILYVNGEGIVPGDGLSWQSSFKTLKEALMITQNFPGVKEIRVASGIYYPTGRQNLGDRSATFLLSRTNLKLLGGYNASDGSRNITTNKTILSGEINSPAPLDNSYHVLSIAGISTSTKDSILVEGFTITGGNGNGTEVYSLNGMVADQNVGGGIYMKTNQSGSRTVISKCIVEGNRATNGAGLWLEMSNPLIQNTVISNNIATNETGGAGLKADASARFINCVFFNNHSENKGGGAVSVLQSDPVFTNTTFVANSSVNGSQALYINGGTTRLSNSIVWKNAGYKGNTIQVASGSINASYNLIQQSGSDFFGIGNRNSDPLFENTGSYLGLRLQTCSPGINAGNNTASDLPLNDFAGNSRIQMGRVDMGAFESVGEFATAGISSSNQSITNFQQSDGISVYTDQCNNIITSITGIGAPQAINGNTTARVWIESNQPSNYVRRHYELTPDQDAAHAVGRITLYFTQAEFDDFNAANITKLPTRPADPENYKKNLLIEKLSGQSSDGSGLPGTYSGGVQTLYPVDTDIVWNARGNRWEVSFEVTGFSGFFVKTQQTPLPLKLISFKGSKEGEINLLEWETVDELKVRGFEVERSSDGRNFLRLATMSALNGREQRYKYSDATGGAANIYYRLKIVDEDGTFQYSSIVSLSRTSSEIVFGPNPVDDHLTIRDVTSHLIHTKVEVVDLNGRKVDEFVLSGRTHTFKANRLSPGIYMVKFTNGQVIRILKQ